MITPPPEVSELVERFERNIDAYRRGRYNETQLRREFVDPLFCALGWDVDNRAGHAEAWLYDACESIVPGIEVIQLYAESEDKDLAKKLSSLVKHLRDFLTTPEPIGESGYIQWHDPFSIT